MPLLPTTLKQQLQALSEHPGSTIADCAKQWSDAVQAYAVGIVPPSTTVAVAAGALQGQLTSAFATLAAAPLMDQAFTAFALAVGGGMAPAFVAVPPPAPLGFATLFAEPYPSTAEAFAERMGTAIDLWMRTGTATPSIGGSPVPWS